jgi:hypothetical protein
VRPGSAEFQPKRRHCISPGRKAPVEGEEKPSPADTALRIIRDWKNRKKQKLLISPQRPHIPLPHSDLQKCRRKSRTSPIPQTSLPIVGPP